MKRKIVLECIIAFIICSLTGCTLKEEFSSKISDIKENIDIESNEDEKAYIPVKYLFEKPFSSECDFTNRKKYYDIIKDEKYSLENKLYILNTLYLNNYDFFYYIPIKNQFNYTYLGNYKISSNGKFIFNYKELNYNDLNNKKIKINVYDTYENRFDENKQDIMISANKNESMIGANVEHIFSPDKSSYIPIDYWYNTVDSKWTHNINSIPTPNEATQVFLKGNYIISEQKGYSFEQINSKNEFVLYFDDTGLREHFNPLTGEPTSDAWTASITFNNDNTWEVTESSAIISSEIKYSKGNWELFDNHILLIHPSKEMKREYRENEYCMFYLDFNEEKIYIPCYVRCDDILDIIHKLESN